jgi:hypothetical protein
MVKNQGGRSARAGANRASGFVHHEHPKYSRQPQKSQPVLPFTLRVVTDSAGRFVCLQKMGRAHA